MDTERLERAMQLLKLELATAKYRIDYLELELLKSHDELTLLKQRNAKC